MEGEVGRRKDWGVEGEGGTRWCMNECMMDFKGWYIVR